MKSKSTSHLGSSVSGFAHSVKKLGVVGILTAVTSFGAFSARADTFAYANWAGSFDTLDLNTGNLNYLAPSLQLEGLAVLDGTFYAYENATVNGTSGTNLFTVDPTNGNSTFVGFSDVSYIYYALGSTMSGLYTVGLDGDLYSINPSTGASSLIGPTGVPGNFLSLFDALSTNASTLYFSAGPDFYELNTATGAATVVGNGNAALNTSALAMVGGVLYGAVENTHLLTIDMINPIDGSTTGGPIVSDYGTLSGLAPIPEPSTWSMIGAGGIGLLGMMSRRRRRG